MVAPNTPAVPNDVRNTIDAWASNPSAHPLIGDWRFAGYARGRVPITAPSRITSSAGDWGIEVDTDEDVSAALQAAVDELGRTGGGVLELSAGRYRLDRPLLMRHSRVVLRGAGKHRTTLFFSRPLADSLGPAVSPDGVQTGWSWSGGQVFFISQERFDASSAADWAGTDPHTEGWLTGEVLTNLGPAARGATVVDVDSTALIRPGAMVLIEMDNDPEHHLLRHMAGDVEGASAYAWSTRADTIAGPDKYTDFLAWNWPVRVTEILSPTRIRLEQPLKLPIDAASNARLRELGPTVHDSGVEDLTIENALRTQTTHNLNPGSNGVCFQAVHDCWVRNVHVVNADMAFGMTSAKSCTLVGLSAGGRSLHHFVACRVQSHDNLVEDFELHEFTIPAVQGSYLHGLNVEGLSSGNVFRQGVLHTGTFDSHRQLPFENLRTSITVTNKDGVPGGAPTAGPYFGARSVHWGIHVTNDYNLCMDISDMAPSSLTAGITGLSKPGSLLPNVGMDFDGDLQSQAIAFGVNLGEASDLLEVQLAQVPVTWPEPGHEEPRPRVGLCSVTLRAESPSSVIRLAAAAGLESIEWGSDVHVPAGDLALAREVGEQTRAANLAVSSYGSYLRFPWATHEEHAEDIVATAQALGAPRIRVWAGPCASAEADADTRRSTAADLNKVAQLAAAAGLELAIEFHLGTLADTTDSTRRLLTEIGHGKVTTYWQPRVGASDEESLTDLEALGSDVSAIHVFSWGSNFERYPLEQRHALWQSAITQAVRRPGVTDLLIEFLPGDDAALLASEAAVLRKWRDAALSVNTVGDPENEEA